MKLSLVPVICAAIIAGSALSAPAFAQEKTAKACADEWRANKAANQDKGITEKAYVAKCKGGATAAAPAAAPDTKKEAAAAAKAEKAAAAAKAKEEKAAAAAKAKEEKAAPLPRPRTKRLPPRRNRPLPPIRSLPVPEKRQRPVRTNGVPTRRAFRPRALLKSHT